jgi:hypothetical protein
MVARLEGKSNRLKEKLHEYTILDRHIKTENELMEVRVTNLLSKIDRLKQKNKGPFQRNRKLQKTARKHVIINQVLKKEIRNMKKQERLQMLVAAAATLRLLSFFDFFLLPEDKQRLQYGGMLVSSFDHVFAYILSHRPPFPYPVPLPFGFVMTDFTSLYHSMGLLKVFLRFKLFLCILML